MGFDAGKKGEGNNRRNAETLMNLKITKYDRMYTEHKAIFFSSNQRTSTLFALTNTGRRQPDRCGCVHPPPRYAPVQDASSPPKAQSGGQPLNGSKLYKVDCLPPKLSFIEV